MTTPLTGSQYQIEAGSYRATITGLGAGLRELRYDGKPVIEGYEPDELPPGGAGQFLAPWPNRIDAGKYTFDGAELQLAVSEPARSTAIHGLTRWAVWTPVHVAPDAISLRSPAHGQQGYPFSVEIDVEYRLDSASGLRVTITARNVGSHPAPYGNGWHPYLTVRTASIDECELVLPATHWLPLDDRGIPAGSPKPVDGTKYDFRQSRRVKTTILDDALTDLVRDDDGLAWTHLSANGTRVSLWAGDGYGWLQVFTSDTLGPDRYRKAIAVEPMTCPPNAFVTGHDLIVLQPGADLTNTWGIKAQTT